MKHLTFSEFLQLIQSGKSPDNYEFSWGTKSVWYNVSRFDGTLDEFHVRDLLFREKQKYINVNGFKVPAPETVAPDISTKYYLPISSHELYHEELYYHNDLFDARILQRGMLHLTKENAVKHAKAMIGIDPNI